jgi:hypothetical protein
MPEITYSLPATGYIAPSLAELRALYAIVIEAHPRLKSEETQSEFARAFWAVGHQFRLDAPNASLDPTYLVEQANILLRRSGAEPVMLSSFFLACRASCDICWRAHDPAKGEILALGLDPFSGRKTSNRWLRLLETKTILLAPVPPRENSHHWGSTPSPQVTISQLDMVSGRMVPLGDSDRLWGHR